MVVGTVLFLEFNFTTEQLLNWFKFMSPGDPDEVRDIEDGIRVSHAGITAAFCFGFLGYIIGLVILFSNSSLSILSRLTEGNDPISPLVGFSMLSLVYAILLAFFFFQPILLGSSKAKELDVMEQSTMRATSLLTGGSALSIILLLGAL